MCHQLNDAMLKALNGPEIHLIAKDDLECPKFLLKRARKILLNYDEDDSMTAGLQETIIIKKGVRVMLKRNIDVNLGLVNGSIGTVIEVKWHPDDHNKVNKVKRVVIKFGNFRPYELAPVKSKFEVINRAYVHREQFPICVAYAVTIHKSQGLSLQSALIDIGSSVFSCGQAYVALSRVNTLKGVHLINLDINNIIAQKSAIKEYNRLRSIYRTDMAMIETTKSYRKKIKDRKWAMPKIVSVVQDADSQRKREKRKRCSTRKNSQCKKNISRKNLI